MPEAAAALVRRIRDLEDQLETEFDRRRTDFGYSLQRRRVVFEAEAARRNRAFRTTLLKYVTGARLLIVLTVPFIYAVIVPLLLLDLLISLYQAVCFPVYGVAKVRRRDFIVFDRHHLSYLNGVEKLNCAYCAYGNGILAYAREIAARTEQYWCPIKHAQRIAGAHPLYPGFVDYGDAEGYRANLDLLRARLRDEPTSPGGTKPEFTSG